MERVLIHRSPNLHKSRPPSLNQPPHKIQVPTQEPRQESLQLPSPPRHPNHPPHPPLAAMPSTTSSNTPVWTYLPSTTPSPTPPFIHPSHNKPLHNHPLNITQGKYTSSPSEMAHHTQLLVSTPHMRAQEEPPRLPKALITPSTPVTRPSTRVLPGSVDGTLPSTLPNTNSTHTALTSHHSHPLPPPPNRQPPPTMGATLTTT